MGGAHLIVTGEVGKAEDMGEKEDEWGNGWRERETKIRMGGRRLLVNGGREVVEKQNRKF